MSDNGTNIGNEPECNECRNSDREIDRLEAKIKKLKTDIKIVTEFVLDCFPGYEDEISWGDNMEGVESYDWGAAALRLREALCLNSTDNAAIVPGGN